MSNNTVNVGGRAHWEIRLQGYEPSPLGSIFWSREVLVTDSELVEAVQVALGRFGYVDELKATRITRHDFEILA